MARSAEQIIREALQLPEAERARLATELLNTLEPESPSGEQRVREWNAEIERRARAALSRAPALSRAKSCARVQDRLAGKCSTFYPLFRESVSPLIMLQFYPLPYGCG